MTGRLVVDKNSNVDFIQLPTEEGIYTIAVTTKTQRLVRKIYRQ